MQEREGERTSLERGRRTKQRGMQQEAQRGSLKKTRRCDPTLTARTISHNHLLPYQEQSRNPVTLRHSPIHTHCLQAISDHRSPRWCRHSLFVTGCNVTLCFIPVIRCSRFNADCRLPPIAPSVSVSTVLFLVLHPFEGLLLPSRPWRSLSISIHRYHCCYHSSTTHPYVRRRQPAPV